MAVSDRLNIIYKCKKIKLVKVNLVFRKLIFTPGSDISKKILSLYATL